MPETSKSRRLGTVTSTLTATIAGNVGIALLTASQSDVTGTHLHPSRTSPCRYGLDPAGYCPGAC